MSESGAGIIYALRNKAMPGLVKIGKTSRDVNARMREMYGTGVPLPFECIVAREVEEAAEVEKALHEAFEPYRINSQREFFRIEARQIQALLCTWPGTDATPLVTEATAGTTEKREAAAEYEVATKKRKKRPPLNFEEMQIPLGAVLHCVGRNETAEVTSERQVRFQGRQVSLTAATQEVFGFPSARSPTHYWTYDGRLLQDIYDETYGSPDG